MITVLLVGVLVQTVSMIEANAQNNLQNQQETSSNDSQEFNRNVLNSNETGKSEEVELVDLRDEYTKYFRVSNSTSTDTYKIIAKTSTNPQHVLINGEWVDKPIIESMTDSELYGTSTLPSDQTMINENDLSLLQLQTNNPPYADTFVSPATGRVPQGGFNPRKPIFVGTHFDPVPQAWYTRSRGLLQFPGLTTPVRNASLKVWYYGTTGGDVALNISTFTPNIDEKTTVWPGPNFGQNYGTIGFSGLIQQNVSFERSSSDISPLLNNSLNQGVVRIGLSAENENNKGVVFCSKEWIAVQCVGKSPILEYELVKPPVPPVPVSPDNMDEFIGNCNQSVIPATGNCSGYVNFDYKLENIREYDKYANDPNNNTQVKIQLSHNNQNFWDHTGWYSAYNTFSLNSNTLDGVFYWRGVTQSGPFSSLDNLGDPTMSKQFTIDTTPPSVPIIDAFPDFVPDNYEFTLGQSFDNTATADNISYFVEISKDPNFAIPEGIIFSSSQTGNRLVQVSGLEDGGVYFIRTKAKDKPANSNEGNISAWSEVKSFKVDGINPEVINGRTDHQRFSPFNETSKNSFDSISAQFNVNEAYFESAALIVKRDNIPIRTIINCAYENIGGVCRSANLSLNSLQDSNALSFVWDGTDDNGNQAGDGVYSLELLIKDKAGNHNLNSERSSFIVILDDTGANIGISFPANQSWVNVDNLTISGGVGGFNQNGKQDRDWQKFEVKDSNSSSSNSWQDISDTVDDLSNFLYNANLTIYQNTFQFRSTDLVDNQVDTLGNPLNNVTKELIINKDIINPHITNFKNTASYKVEDGGTSRQISFELIDSGNNEQQASGFDTGVNPGSLSVSLQSLKLDQNSQWQELMLFDKGQNISGQLATDLDCKTNDTPQNINSKKIVCILKLNNLESNTLYQVNIKAKDTAGNYVCSIGKKSSQYIICDTNGTNSIPDIGSLESGKLLDNPIPDAFEAFDTYFVVDNEADLELNAPVEGAVYSKSKILVSGSAEFGGIININSRNNDLLFSSKVGEDDHDNFNSLECSLMYELKDFGIEKKVCNFEVLLDFSNYLIDGKLDSLLQLELVDESGNSTIKTRNFLIDLYSIDLSVRPNFNYISPNGDGKQDGVIFTTQVSNPLNPNDIVDVDSWTMSIVGINGQEVWKRDGLGLVSPSIQFEGKCNLNNELCGENNWIPDADYTFILHIKSNDGISIATSPQNLYVRTINLSTPVITNPISGYVSTRGVINIQGQAAYNEDENSANQVEICIDILQTPDIQCDLKDYFIVQSNGFFSGISSLPRTQDSAQTQYLIWVVNKDIYGVQSPRSNVVEVTLDTVDPFDSVGITPAFQGINSEEEYRKFLKGEITSDQLKTLLIHSKVTQNTQAVELAYADYTELNELIDTDSKTGQTSKPSDSYEIALINNKQEDSSIINPNGAINLKKNQTLDAVQIANPDSDAYAPCEFLTCNWDYVFSIPPTLSGGKYEMQFKGYKGDTIQSAYAGFVLDGRITSAPRILRMEKLDHNDTFTILNEYQGAYYTNRKQLRITGVADPNAAITLNINQQITLQTKVSSTGLWQIVTDLTDEEGRYQLDVTAQLSSLGSSFTANLEPVIIYLDTTSPKLNSVDTNNVTNPLATNPWVRSGDLVQFNINGNEPLSTIVIQKPDGFNKKLVSTDQYSASGLITIDQQVEGVYYPSVFLSDYAGNGTLYTFNQTIMLEQLPAETNLVLLPVSEIRYTDFQDRDPLDFRLFIDNTLPFETKIETTGWGEKPDGIKADGVLPESDRLLYQFVIKGNSVVLQGLAEKNQRLELNLLSSTKTGFRENKILSTIQPDNVDCRVSGANVKSSDGLISRFGDLCIWKYEFTFEEDGKSPLGIPYNWYLFSVRVVDLAGNVSDYSRSVSVYNDTDNPDGHSITSVGSESYQILPDWKRKGIEGFCPDYANCGRFGYSVNFNDIPITKDKLITTTHTGERQADVQYELWNPRGEFVAQESTLLQNGKNISKQTTWGDNKISLGSSKRDDTDNESCTIVQNTRRTGVCSDGIYTINMRMIDTAGNIGNWDIVQIERDTVDPDKPNFDLEFKGDIFDQRLNLSLQGEAGSLGEITIQKENTIPVVINKKLDAKGNLIIDDLVGKTECGSITYTVSVVLVDRAGNRSNKMTRQRTTKQCPDCSYQTGKPTMSLPIKDPKMSVSGGFPRYGGNSGEVHAGMDFSAFIGTPVFATRTGKVTRVVNSFTDNYGKENAMDPKWGGWGNTVIIEHNDGNLLTIYAHLSPQDTTPVKEGDVVGEGQLIGYVGSTGSSSGPHLHFQIEENGARLYPPHIGMLHKYPAVNPTKYLGTIKGNLTDEQARIYCASRSNRGADNGNIETMFEVEGGWTDGKLKNQDVDKNKRKIQLKLSKRDNELNPDMKDGIDEDTNVWIVSHGWNDTSGSFEDLADSIKNTYSSRKDVVLMLDWSEASFNGKDEWTEGSIGAAWDRGNCYASTWIKPVALGTAKKLEEVYGIKQSQGYRIRVVGHSLGSILSAEIADYYGGSANLVALEPPQDNCKKGYSVTVGKEKNIFGKEGESYKSGEKKKNFRDVTNFSRAYVGAKSSAGSGEHARTASRAFKVDFDTRSYSYSFNEHAWVVIVWDNLQELDKLENEMLTVKDWNQYTDWKPDKTFKVSKSELDGIIIVGENRAIYNRKPPKIEDDDIVRLVYKFDDELVERKRVR